MSEDPIYKSPDVIVTLASVQINGQVFPIPDIKDVTVDRPSPIQGPLIAVVVLLLVWLGYVFLYPNFLNAYQSIFDPTLAQQTARLLQTPQEIIGSKINASVFAVLLLGAFVGGVGYLRHLIKSVSQNGPSLKLTLANGSSRTLIGLEPNDIEGTQNAIRTAIASFKSSTPPHSIIV